MHGKPFFIDGYNNNIQLFGIPPKGRGTKKLFFPKFKEKNNFTECFKIKFNIAIFKVNTEVSSFVKICGCDFTII